MICAHFAIKRRLWLLYGIKLPAEIVVVNHQAAHAAVYGDVLAVDERVALFGGVSLPLSFHSP